MTIKSSTNTNELQGQSVLVIDDEPDMARLIAQMFLNQGCRVYMALDGSEGLNQFYLHQPNLIIVDIMMPDINGWKLCNLIRQSSNVPIIIVSALGRVEDVEHGLGRGADDYVCKPFHPKILIARAQAILRRAALPATNIKPFIYRDPYLTIDTQERRVFVEGNSTKLSDKEFRLLVYLAENAGRVLTIQQILEKIWGWEYLNNTDYVHVYISQLRRKLEKNPREPQYLITEHCVGYRFESYNG